MIWCLADNTLLYEPDGNPCPIDKLAFSADGQWLATAGSPEPRGNTSRAPGIIQVWVVADGRLAKTLKGPRGTTTTLAFSAYGQALNSANADDRGLDLAISVASVRIEPRTAEPRTCFHASVCGEPHGHLACNSDVYQARIVGEGAVTIVDA
jgi:hypothetical protein